MIPERSPRIDASTRLCAVFGHPVRHSGSPAMHNAALESLGLNWRYLAFEVAPASLAEAVAGARDMGFVGINVTVPHKEAALGLVDIQDESARRWGAVNTIRFEGRAPGGSWEPMSAEETARLEERRMVGYNTDADAIVGALEDDLGLDVRGSEVLVVGTGGAGRVAALRLASGGARRLHLVNRTLERARSLAEEIRSRSPGCQASLGYPSGGADLLVNGTSLGLSPSDPLPVDQERFPLSRAAAVFDMIYQPPLTPLLEKARQAGCRTANGLGMLVAQGARALEIWTGREAPRKAMRQALEAHLGAA